MRWVRGYRHGQNRKVQLLQLEAQGNGAGAGRAAGYWTNSRPTKDLNFVVSEMKLKYFFFVAPLMLIFSSLHHLPSPVSSQVCQRYCGNIPLKYPFGSGPGCGDPRFHESISCTQEQLLIFTTHTGSYPVTTIDYHNQIMYISDPTMSTCFCTRPSKGFSLNWDAPFTFHDSTIFALLGCSTAASSPIYKSSTAKGDGTYLPWCDDQSTAVCSELQYSCQPISQLLLNTPISTCCVYTPVDLGPAFEMDLQKLKCSSYTAVYSFDGQEGNPESWKYGAALKYRFNVGDDDHYPSTCAICESSNGVCGYDTTPDNSFSCNCPSGGNTTTDCFFEASWNQGSSLLPQRKGTTTDDIWSGLVRNWVSLCTSFSSSLLDTVIDEAQSSH
ncbi:hypothetical protein Dimus_014998 [Dionaea muscipula]